MVATAIVGVLASSFFFVVNPEEQFAKARDAQRKNDLEQVGNALDAYYGDYNEYPSLLSDLVTGGEQTYMQKVPQDPKGTSYCYEVTNENGKNITYRLSAKLDRNSDPQKFDEPITCNSDSNYNYAVTSTNTSVIAFGIPTPTPITPPTPTSALTPTPTGIPTPTPTPSCSNLFCKVTGVTCDLVGNDVEIDYIITGGYNAFYPVENVWVSEYGLPIAGSCSAPNPDACDSFSPPSPGVTVLSPSPGSHTYTVNCSSRSNVSCSAGSIDSSVNCAVSVPTPTPTPTLTPTPTPSTATFYPSVDGSVIRGGVSETWAGIIAGAGNGVDNTGADFWLVVIQASATEPQFAYNYRSILLFDTSGLPDAANISSATLSIYGAGKSDLLATQPNINIYASTPASNLGLVAADYGQTGTTAFSTAKAWAEWSTTGYNDFLLNAAGMAAISRTGVSKFSAKNATYDAGGIQPNWQSGNASSTLRGYASEKGIGFKPKLVVTYWP